MGSTNEPSPLANVGGWNPAGGYASLFGGVLEQVAGVIHIGITGSRHGATPEQEEALIMLLGKVSEGYDTVVLHHGDCVGVDALAHDYAELCGWRTHVHAPEPRGDGRDYRAYCLADEYSAPKNYLARNRDIAVESNIVIAVPRTMEAPPKGQPKGGTWFTFDVARSIPGKAVYLVLPNGKVEAF